MIWAPRPVLGFLLVFVAAVSVRGETPAGTLTPGRVASPALKHDLHYQVYLPPGYVADGSVRYPVVYLLHGRGDQLNAWATIKPDLDRLIQEGRIPALIAIMPDAPASRRASFYIDSQFTGSADGKLPAGEAVETAFTKDLVEHVDANFPTRRDREGRIVGGYSMGGYGALRYSLAHPGLFGAAVVLSPAVYVPLPPPDSSTREFGAYGKGSQVFDEGIYTALNYPATIPTFVAKGLPLVMFIGVGDDEKALPDPAQAAHDLDYEAHTLYNRMRRVPPVDAQLRVINGSHNWDTWRPTFVEGIQYVFERLAAPAPKR